MSGTQSRTTRHKKKQKNTIPNEEGKKINQNQSRADTDARTSRQENEWLS